MGQFSAGFVYVLANDAMPDVLKIGQTSRLSEDRANDLFTTGIPFPFKVIFRVLTSNQKELESMVHEKLKNFRVNQNREFFHVSPEVAIDAILNAQQQVDGIQAWAKKQPFILKEGDRILLSLRAGQIFTIAAYENFMDRSADVIDLWQAHSDGDTLELYLTKESELTSGFSYNEPFSTENVIPFLDRNNTVANNEMIGRERLVPGDRLIWIDDSY